MALSRGQIQCGKCQGPVEVDISTQPVIINLETVSFVMVEHPTQAICLSCGETVIPTIRGLGGLAIIGQPVPKKEQALIINPNGAVAN